ncbi:hypothetical protein M8J75_010731 [Diaphorina citri]|nr:hypothetical protein M8J75_010731 [Diaphorina citri]
MNIITSPTTTKNNNNQLRGGSVRQVRGISKAEGGRIEPIFTQAMASNFLDYSYTICIHLKPGFCSVVFQSDSKFNVGKKLKTEVHTHAQFKTISPSVLMMDSDDQQSNTKIFGKTYSLHKL